LIELNELCVGYEKRKVLQSLNAVFPNGRLTAIVGPNGSGKTTLLKASAAILPVQSGEILIDGASLLHMKSKDRAKKIAYLSQGRSVPDMSAEQTVLQGRFPHLPYPYIYTERDKAIASEAMARMGVCEFASMPMSALSGGMRQNVYLAMALAQETDYIFLDEPTTYLDIENRFRIMDALRSLANGGKGIVAVLHDLDLALRYADEITVMQGGRIVARDTPDAIFRSKILDCVFHISLQQIQTEDGGAHYVICR
jgi:iron complex transport system ATP-binding protein